LLPAKAKAYILYPGKQFTTMAIPNNSETFKIINMNKTIGIALIVADPITLI